MAKVKAQWAAAVCGLCLFTAAANAVGQDSVSCTELRMLETTVCEASDGTATIAVHTDSSYTVTNLDKKSWSFNKPLLLQKEADAEASRTKEHEADVANFGKPAPPAPATSLPPADYLNTKAATFHSKKECLAAGFHWDKKSSGKGVCYFQ